MSAREFQLRVNNESVAFVRCWQPATSARGVVQIIHGLAEHGGRYARFASALNAAGFAVYAQDLPGHGRTARAPDELGHLADDHGWRLTLQAIRAVQVEIRERHPGLPIFLFGHSMGALLAQDYIIHHGREIRACVLSAATGDLGMLRAPGLALMRAEIRIAGLRHRSKLAEALSFKSFNRRFRPNRTGFDWLSRDPAEVDRYIDDPRCGFRASCALWAELLSIGARLRQPARLARIPKTLPVMMVSGTDDAATHGAKGPTKLERAYIDAGLRDVSLRLYQGGRHELLNDTCRDEVTQDVVQWLQAKLSNSGA